MLEDQINVDNVSINGWSTDPCDTYLKNKIIFLDISSGFFYGEDFWFGVSFKHLNTPNIAF